MTKNDLNPIPNKPWNLRVRSRSTRLLKTLRKKEKLWKKKKLNNSGHELLIFKIHLIAIDWNF